MDRYQFYDGVYVYFVTFTIIDWLPVFIDPNPIQIIVDSLNFCIQGKSLRINAYVLMPNHLHLIVFDAKFDNLRLHQTLVDFRKFTGKRLADHIDSNLCSSWATVIRSQDLEDRQRLVWQPGWHAEGLASEKFWKQKLNYIHENPVRKGFVRSPEHWCYSSAGYWLGGEVGDVPVVPVEGE